MSGGNVVPAGLGTTAWRQAVGWCGKMGIRFYCPNGHKLNVKSFQAGRRGICPYCGVSVQIPTVSTRPSSKEAKDQHAYPLAQDPGAGAAPLAQPPHATPAATPSGRVADGGSGQLAAPPAAAPTPMTPIAPVAASVPVQRPAQGPGPAQTTGQAPAAAPGQPAGFPTPVASPSPAASPSPVESLPASAPTDMAVPTTADLAAAASIAPAAVESPPPSSGIRDPLAEAPDAVWYVQPLSGGQFGPASNDIMRSWIDEGRVSPDSLVWREGWRDWQEASATFPQLGAGEETFGAGLITATGSGSTGAARGRHRAPSRRQSNAVSIAIITVLILAVIALFGVFVWVLTGEPEGQSENSISGAEEAVRFLLPSFAHFPFAVGQASSAHRADSP